jgi:hypothetical protein
VNEAFDGVHRHLLAHAVNDDDGLLGKMSHRMVHGGGSLRRLTVGHDVVSNLQ